MSFAKNTGRPSDVNSVTGLIAIPIPCVYTSLLFTHVCDSGLSFSGATSRADSSTCLYSPLM